MRTGEPARRLGAALTSLAVVLGGCAGPRQPDWLPALPAAPAAYKEAAGWVQAGTGVTVPQGSPWWAMFGDPALDTLERQVEAANPDLAAAVANLDRANALIGVERADLFPTVDVGVDAARQRLSGRRPLASGSASFTTLSAGASLGWEIDLWGRIRGRVRAARSDTEAAAGDLAAVRLSLQASLADTYFRLRGIDAELGFLRRAVAAYTRALELTEARHDGGIASGLDVSRARTLLSDTRAEVSALANQRAEAEHALAALLGARATEFSLATQGVVPPPPPVSVGVPSELVQRRPDIVAAQARVEAANARIGVARTAFFPSLTLGAAGGVQATGGDLFSASATYWALGPLSALLTVFDAGRRRAQVRVSEAEYARTTADYRGTVLVAFREVEDALAAGRTLATQAIDRQDAAAAAGRTEELALTRYRDGASDYLEVVTAQTAALDAQRSAIRVATLRLQAVVAIVRALGGGYSASSPS